MTIEADTRRLVAQLLHALSPFAGDAFPFDLEKVEMRELVTLTVSEGDHATARAAVASARAALGYPTPQGAPLRDAALPRQAGTATDFHARGDVLVRRYAV